MDNAIYLGYNDGYGYDSNYVVFVATSEEEALDKLKDDKNAQSVDVWIQSERKPLPYKYLVEMASGDETATIKEMYIDDYPMSLKGVDTYYGEPNKGDVFIRVHFLCNEVEDATEKCLALMDKALSDAKDHMERVRIAMDKYNNSKKDGADNVD